MHHYFGNGPTLVLYPTKIRRKWEYLKTHLIAKPLLDSTTISQAKDVENSKYKNVYLKHATPVAPPRPHPRKTHLQMVPTLLLEKQEVVLDGSTLVRLSSPPL